MFEYIKQLESTNTKFYPIDISEISNAEEQMGFEFPESLKAFYKEIGYGFFGSNKNFINRLMSPEDIADYVCGADIYEYVDKSFYGENELVFFHISDEDFLTIVYKGENKGNILYFGDKVADNFQEFIKKIINIPDYYI